MIFGRKIRELRDEQGILQRQLAALLEIDTPMFSKIERGDRKAKREQVIMLADALKVDREELLALWLADQITTVLSSEKPIANKALSIVSKHISEIR